MIIPPIPINALCHSCTLCEVAEKNVWGSETIIETELTNVRIEPCSIRRFSINGDIPQYRAKLFYDAELSSPKNISFETGDKIRFNGKEYVVSEVEECYGLNRIHHLEVMLI